MDEDGAKPASTAGKKSSKRTTYLVGAVALVIVAAAIGAALWKVTPEPKKPASTGAASLQADIRALQKSDLDFPLYAPATLPEGFTVVEDSADTFEGNVMTFSVLAPGAKKFVITEQKRPPLMEELKKVTEFSTPIGEGYIADLEGRLSGIILTKETLLIFSSSEKPDSDTLQALMKSMSTL